MPLGMELQILGEEMGEVCEALGRADIENLKEELVQVAAVAVKWVEYLKELPHGTTGMGLLLIGAKFGEVCRALCEKDLDGLRHELACTGNAAFQWLDQIKELPPNAGGGKPCP